jgi:hypothetical protein
MPSYVFKGFGFEVGEKEVRWDPERTITATPAIDLAPHNEELRSRFAEVG